jgi:hypothetical protein
MYFISLIETKNYGLQILEDFFLQKFFCFNKNDAELVDPNRNVTNECKNFINISIHFVLTYYETSSNYKLNKNTLAQILSLSLIFEEEYDLQFH